MILHHTLGDCGALTAILRGRLRIQISWGLAILLLSFVGCTNSDAGNGGGNAGGSVGTEESLGRKLQQPIAEWATAAADAYRKQLDSGTAIDHTVVIQAIAPTTERLRESICKEAEQGEGAGRASDPEREISTAVDEALARALARTPQLLVAIGMTTWGRWPPFVLKEPAPAPETPVSGLPESLAQFVKPEFIDSEGGLKLPSEGEPAYQDFQRWFYEPSLDNELLERSVVTSQSLKSDAEDCYRAAP